MAGPVKRLDAPFQSAACSKIRWSHTCVCEKKRQTERPTIEISKAGSKLSLQEALERPEGAGTDPLRRQQVSARRDQVSNGCFPRRRSADQRGSCSRSAAGPMSPRSQFAEAGHRGDQGTRLSQTWSFRRHGWAAPPNVPTLPGRKKHSPCVDRVNLLTSEHKREIRQTRRRAKTSPARTLVVRAGQQIHNLDEPCLARCLGKTF